MISDSEMYAEAFEILACMNKQDVMKIPVDILEFLKKEKSKTYITRIDKDDILNPNNIDQRTINFLNGLNITYIADEEEKEKIIEICKTNAEFLCRRTFLNVNIFCNHRVLPKARI